MKLDIDEQGMISVKEVYNTIRFISDDGVELFLCMRDGGYEFKYGGRWYRVNNGKVLPMPKQDLIKNIDHGFLSE